MTRSKLYFFFNDERHFNRFLWGLVFLAVFAGLGMIFVPLAQAQAAAFSCNGGTANGNLFQQDTISNQLNDQSGGSVTVNASSTNTANGDPYANGGACVDSSTHQFGVFGRLMCFFKSTVGQIVSTMYCNFQNTLQGPLSIAIMLFIAVSGIAIVTGMVQFNAKEGMIMLIKIALIWAFATNATWGIGIAYSFFIGLAEQGSNLVLGAIGGSGGSGGGAYLTQPDRVMGALLGFTTATAGSGGGFLPATLSATCAAWLFTFLLLLLLFLPWVAGLVITLMIQYLWIYARALLGYLTALVMISFLFVLSPLFISFALFKITYPMFEQWLKYITSFSLQMVFVFAFIAMLTMVPMGAFFTEVLSLIRDYDGTLQLNNVDIPGTFCSICPYKVDLTADITSATPPVTCISAAPATPSSTSAIPLSNLFTETPLVEAIVAQVIALWIIGQVLQDFMKRAPEFARNLSGRMHFVAALSGSAAADSDSPPIEYLGMDKIEAGIEGLKSRLVDSSSNRQQWISRLLPAVGIAAGGYLAGNALHKGGAAGHGTGGGASAGGGGGYGGSGPYGGMYGAGFGSGGMGTPTEVQRAGLGDNILQKNYAQSRAFMDENFGNAQAALLQVAFLKGPGGDPQALDKALQNLSVSRDAYLASANKMYQNQETIMRARITEMQQKAGQVPGAPGAPSVDSVMTLSERRTQVKDTLDSLQLQVSIEQQLNPGERVEKANELLQAAMDKQAQAKTAEDFKTLDEIQLHEIENIIKS